MPEPTTGCWLWIGKTDMLGYGSVRREHTSETKAHRLTKENVLEIKNTFVPGTKSWRTLAEKFNVSQSLIHSIIRGHVWI